MDKTKEILNELLVEVFNHILSIEEEQLKSNGITLSIKEVHVLEAISLVNDKTMGNVAKKLRITIGSLTISIDRLVKKGYVLRANDPDDRRKVLVDTTHKGREVLKIHKHFHDTMLNDIIEDQGINEQESLINSLENIKNYFKFKY